MGRAVKLQLHSHTVSERERADSRRPSDRLHTIRQAIRPSYQCTGTPRSRGPVQYCSMVTSETTVLPPKKKRKDYPHCVRVDVIKDDVDEL
eukprot:COSAG02_NODE_2460_length_8797_cov_6.129915_9_plen_91_part_00